MQQNIEFGKEYTFEFEINFKTKNEDHLTTTELFSFIEKVSVEAKKTLGVKYILAQNIQCEFFRRTKPKGTITLIYKITREEVFFSFMQNNKLTAKGSCKIAKLVI